MPIFKFMTREEMLNRYSISDGENNYQEAQRRIAEAMKKGEKYVYLPGKCNTEDFSWVATSETISRLIEDGFDVDKVWDPWEYWSIEWYDN